MRIAVTWYPKDSVTRSVREKEYPPRDFAIGIVKAWATKNHKRDDSLATAPNTWLLELGSTDNCYGPPWNLYTELIGGMEINNLFDATEGPNFDPYVSVTELSKKWIVIEWSYSADEFRGNGLARGIFFAYCSDKHWVYVPVPENCRVVNSALDIILHYEGLDLVFARDTKGWPDVILDPQRWISLGLLNYMLSADDACALTNLFRSKDPLVRGFAVQIKRTLQLICENYPLPR